MRADPVDKFKTALEGNAILEAPDARLFPGFYAVRSHTAGESVWARVGARRAALLATAVIFLGLAAARAFTDSPGCDEGWFANPAFNLVTYGHMGTTVIEEANLPMTTGIHALTYWIMPLQVLTQAAWYKLFGFGLFTMRSLSILFGLISLAAWFSIIRSFTPDKSVALLTVFLVAIDFAFVRGAANGRMDMMCAALNFSAIALYLRLREHRLGLAILVANSLLAASLLTHPNGVLGLFFLVPLALLLDRPRMKLSHLVVAGLPYLLGAAAYAPYVMRDLPLFVTQLSGNGGGRLWGLANPLSAIKVELIDRYLGSSSGGAGVLKLGLVAAYAMGVALSLASQRVRENRHYRALLISSALIVVYFTWFEGTKLYLYLVHLTPALSALLAASAVQLWQRYRLRPFALATVVSVMLLNLAGTAYVIKRNSLHTGYEPAVRFLNEHSTASTTVFGTAELSFSLQQRQGLLDDKWLGYETGRQADFVVIDARYRQEHAAVSRREPQIYSYITGLLADRYDRVYSSESFEIYSRR
jgi:4-amino-4-deoxy-L-arabinose transferase-like glycosyltransferase